MSAQGNTQKQAVAADSGEIRLGRITVPSGMLVIADTITLANVGGDEDDEDGEAAVIGGLPTDRAIEIYGTPSDVGPWVDKLRVELGGEPSGEPEVVATITPATHEVILIDCDATDRFSMDGKKSHYGQLKKTIKTGDDTYANVAEIDGMSIGIAMLAMPAVGSESDVRAYRDARGEIVRLVVSF